MNSLTAIWRPVPLRPLQVTLVVAGDQPLRMYDAAQKLLQGSALADALAAQGLTLVGIPAVVPFWVS
jgi:hypothetical protein